MSRETPPPRSVTPRRVPELRSGTRKAGWVAVACGAGFVVGAIVLANVSVSKSYDSRCDPIVSSHAEWVTESRCGVVNIGTLVIVITLAVVGLLTVAIGALALSGRRARAQPFVVAVAIVAVAGLLLLVAKVETHDEPVLRAGWRAVRNVAAGATVAVCIAAAWLTVTDRASRDRR